MLGRCCVIYFLFFRYYFKIAAPESTATKFVELATLQVSPNHANLSQSLIVFAHIVITIKIWVIDSQQQLMNSINRKLSTKMMIPNTLGEHKSYFIFKTLPKTNFYAFKVRKKRCVIFCPCSPPPFLPTFVREKKSVFLSQKKSRKRRGGKI